MLVRIKPMRPIYGVKDFGPIRNEEALDLDEMKIRKCLLNGRVYTPEGEEITQKNVLDIIEKWNALEEIPDAYFEEGEESEEPETVVEDTKEEVPAENPGVTPVTEEAPAEETVVDEVPSIEEQVVEDAKEEAPAEETVAHVIDNTTETKSSKKTNKK